MSSEERYNNPEGLKAEEQPVPNPNVGVRMVRTNIGQKTRLALTARPFLRRPFNRGPFPMQDKLISSLTPKITPQNQMDNTSPNNSKQDE